MLLICETYCDLRDLTIGKIMFYHMVQRDEMRPANGCLIDGAVVAEIVCSKQIYNL